MARQRQHEGRTAPVASPEVGDRARAVRAVWAAVRRGALPHPGHHRVSAEEWLHDWGDSTEAQALGLTPAGVAALQVAYVDTDGHLTYVGLALVETDGRVTVLP